MHDSNLPDSVSEAPETGDSHRRKRRRLRFLVYVVAVYAAWCTALYLYQDRLVFPAGRAPRAAADFRLAAEGAVRFGVELETGGHAEGWLVPAPGVDSEHPGPVVVFFHGNAEIVDQQCDIIQGYHRLECSVFLPEYRGYGRSAGRPSQRGIVEDGVRFYDQLKGRADVDPARIVFHGRSLGGGVAAQVAHRRRPRAMILQSTFTSVAVMAHGYLAPEFLARHPFRTDRILGELDVSLLLFHGSRDRIIPVKHGRALSRLAPDTVYVEYDCGHNDFPGAGNEDDYWNRIARFLEDTGVLK
jgi:fermentation-respiration switch protein FrsA (DUF1100 family)